MTRSRRSDSGFSVFRIGIFAAVLGAVFVVGGFLLFSLEQAGLREPLNIDPPTGSELRDQVDGNSSSRRLYYFIPGMTAEDVAAYYNGKLKEFYGNDWTETEQCRRLPRDGNVDNYVPGSGVVPYIFRCLFENSGFESDRFTQIDIQPGVRNDASGENYEGNVIVEYIQQWQP
ncbi:MAG TPA: hypothetical protein VHL11_14685 [Phototrophicaceae bacterium]|jgi:hypothetical protein|nr:hypothetical protein [Phototrophicaceae bacterium]